MSCQTIGISLIVWGGRGECLRDVVPCIKYMVDITRGIVMEHELRSCLAWLLLEVGCWSMKGPILIQLFTIIVVIIYR